MIDLLLHRLQLSSDTNNNLNREAVVLINPSHVNTIQYQHQLSKYVMHIIYPFNL